MSPRPATAARRVGPQSPLELAMSQGKVKGTIMAEVVKYLRSRREAARAALPPRLSRYLDTRILASSWYPEADYLELMRVIAGLIPERYLEDGLSAFEVAGRNTSTSYVEGAYKTLVRKGDPLRTLSNFQALWRLRHDTGSIEVERTGERAARIELHDYALVAPEACAVIQGSFWGFLRHSGARDPKLEHSLCRARGDAHCEWHVEWA